MFQGVWGSGAIRRLGRRRARGRDRRDLPLEWAITGRRRPRRGSSSTPCGGAVRTTFGPSATGAASTGTAPLGRPYPKGARWRSGGVAPPMSGPSGPVSRIGDGTAWSTAEPFVATDGASLVRLRSVWGSGPSNVWAVGDGGHIFRWDGRLWSTMNTTGGQLLGLWGSGASDIWAVESGSVLHWNGAVWCTAVGLPNLYGVWGTSATDVWVVGSQGAILHRSR